MGACCVVPEDGVEVVDELAGGGDVGLGLGEDGAFVFLVADDEGDGGEGALGGEDVGR